jgi:predicted alpha/beta-hydrolase family hydrolase
MEVLINEPKVSSPVTFILAHGAGAAMDTEFMETFANGIAKNGFKCVRFEFPYMNHRRKELNKRPPDKIETLIKSWKSVIDQYRSEILVIGGKSMGGRIASLIADESDVLATVLLGYPFVAPNKTIEERTFHLRKIVTPTLICQGTRDRMGDQQVIKRIVLPKCIEFHWAIDGDHSLVPLKKSPATKEGNWSSAISRISEFVSDLR